MSARDVALVLNHSQATGTDKVVLLGIAWHMSDTWGDGSYPGIERLAVYAGVSERTVIRSLKNLEELGEIEVHRHSGRSYGGPKTNRYWVMVECPDTCQRDLWHRPLEDIDPKFPVDNLVDKSDTPAKFDINR